VERPGRVAESHRKAVGIEVADRDLDEVIHSLGEEEMHRDGLGAALDFHSNPDLLQPLRI